MPVLFDENRIRDSSAEKEAPKTDVVSRNCSIVYCLNGRRGALAWLFAGPAWPAKAADRRMGAIHFIARIVTYAKS